MHVQVHSFLTYSFKFLGILLQIPWTIIKSRPLKGIDPHDFIASFSSFMNVKSL